MRSSHSERRLQRETAQRQVQRQAETRELLAFREFSRLVACGMEFDALLKAILEKLLAIFKPAEAGALFLYRRGPDSLVVGHALGYDTDTVHRISLKVGEGIAGKAFQSGQAGLCTTPQQVAEAMVNITPQNRACLERAVFGCKQPCSVLSLPLVCGDTKIGAVVLENWRGNGEFSQDDLELAQTLASLLVAVVDRARLGREIEYDRGTLEGAGKLQQDIMATLSHEMRTPLASIKGYASALLLDDVQWDEQTKREYLEIIVEESNKLGEIIADLLEASLIDAGRLEIQKEPTLLARLAQEVVDELARHTDKHHFLVSFPPHFPIVDADSGRIRRVLLNLLDNAVKYSPAGGLVVVHGEVRENEVIISVADQGQGIAPEHLNRLFERFFRVKFVSGHHVVGSGLGLPIARNIVEAHGGRIWAESKLGEGTTVYFTLPLGGLSTGIEAAEE